MALAATSQSHGSIGFSSECTALVAIENREQGTRLGQSPEPPPLVIADAIQDSRLDPITVCEQPHVRFQKY